MRTYYVSSSVVEHSCYNGAGLDCCIQDKKDCIVDTIENEVTTTDTEVARHGLAIMYKDMLLKGHNFQLSFSYVDCGDNGNEFDGGETFTQKDRQDKIKSDSVLIYSLGEENDDSTLFYSMDVLADSTGTEVLGNIVSTNKNLDTKLLKKEILEEKVVLVPVLRSNSKHDYVHWSTDSNMVYRFHERYMPQVYSSVSKIFSDKLTVSKDFVLYDFYAMSKKTEVDSANNTWVSLCYQCSLSVLNLMELDNSGKTHMYVLDNFKDVNKLDIYSSFLLLELKDIELSTILGVIEKVQPISTKWFEEYLMRLIQKDGIYTYIDTIVKYTRVSKKSKDRNIDMFLDMLLCEIGSSSYTEGYTRVLKALKLTQEELDKYLNLVIECDKKRGVNGGLVYSIIYSWKGVAPEILLDYLYGGIKWQGEGDFEEQQKQYTNNYFRLLSCKGVNKVTLLSRYTEDVREGSEYYTAQNLLEQLLYFIARNSRELDEYILEQFIHYLEEFDTYGEYAQMILPAKTVHELFNHKFSRADYKTTYYYNNVYDDYLDRLEAILKHGVETEIKNRKNKVLTETFDFRSMSPWLYR